MGLPVGLQQVVVIGGLGRLDDNVRKTVRHHDRFGWRRRRWNTNYPRLLMGECCFQHWAEAFFAMFLEGAKQFSHKARSLKLTMSSRQQLPEAGPGLPQLG